jgi:hypothetical protein
MLAAILAIPFSMLAFALVLGRVKLARILAVLAFLASLLPLAIGSIAVRSRGRAMASFA